MARRREYPPVTEDLLAEIVRRILAAGLRYDVAASAAQAGDVLRIVLFGSHARGEARTESDLDLLIIERSDLPRYERSPKYYRATHGTFPARYIVVWTPEEVAEWREVPNHFVTAALREGRVLYERPR